MGPSIYIFSFLGLLLLAQSVIALRDGFRFIAYVRRSRRQPVGDYAPRAAVIVPVKGLDSGVKTNLLSFLTQQYADYQIIFVVESENDPAFPLLKALVAQTAKERSAGLQTARLVTSGASQSNGQKVHNLLRGIDLVDSQTEILAFADADARPGPEWLRSLVAPLARPEVTVSTGFRWYLPSESFVSRLCAAWDASIATMLGDHGRNFAWGGSMAIRARDFKQFDVARRYWASTVSDDYALLRAVQDAKGWVRFEPRCLVASRYNPTFAEFLRWANRQIIITRVYAPRLWRLGLVAHLLYSGTILFGLILLINPGTTTPERLAVAAFLVIILGLGIAKGRIRTVVAREVFPEEQLTMKDRGNCYWQLAPLVPWVMLCNFVTAGLTRHIEWRGIHYRLHSDHQVEIVRREFS